MKQHTPTYPELLAFAGNHNSEHLPLDMLAHVHRLKSAPAEFDDCPITRSVAAILVSKTPATLAVMASTGDFSLPFYRSGRSVRYTLKAIKNYLRHTVQGEAA